MSDLEGSDLTGPCPLPCVWRYQCGEGPGDVLPAALGVHAQAMPTTRAHGLHVQDSSRCSGTRTQPPVRTTPRDALCTRPRAPPLAPAREQSLQGLCSPGPCTVWRLPDLSTRVPAAPPPVPAELSPEGARLQEGVGSLGGQHAGVWVAG